MQKILVADSGGTRTDWCLISEKGEKQFFSGVSFHPVQWNEDFIKEQTHFWRNHPELTEAKLVFYGAGCMNPAVATKMKEAFINWGFPSVEIFSDIHAAGVASFGDQHGFVAIMGTGSVFAELNKKEIIQLRGGLGYLLGDEGSGYYFGKRLIQKYLNNEFDPDLQSQLNQLLGNRTEVINKVYQSSGKSFVASIAESVSTIVHPSIIAVHEENIQLFLDPFLNLTAVKDNGISFCGSYACGNQELVRKILSKRNIISNTFVKKPIVGLAEYTMKATL